MLWLNGNVCLNGSGGEELRQMYADGKIGCTIPMDANLQILE